MRKLFLFIPFIFYAITNLNGQECFPDEKELFQYYGNLILDEVPEEFSKEDLINLMKERYGEAEIIEEKIEVVEKSFATAVTPFLQLTVSMFSTSNNLEETLSKYDKVFKLVEFICRPENVLLFEPNDYSLGPNFHHKSHLELVKAKEAFDVTQGDSRILIGISDTYLETTHEDLENKIEFILGNSSGTSNSAWHGVHVSGCAAADTDNARGISSTGFNSKIAFTSGMFLNEVLQLSQIPGVRVINMSWYSSCNPTVTDELVVNEIRNDNNVVLVAGAGNNPSHCGDNAYIYPAVYESVISVTSVGHISDIGYVDPTWGANNWKDCHEEVIGQESSTHHHNDKVNIAAPGYNVKSTGLNNSYAGSWGTSFAAPMVAGICALVTAVNPCLTAAEIQEIVLNSADPSLYSIPENSDYIGLLGTGRVDAHAAVNLALEKGRIHVQNESFFWNEVRTSETDIYTGNSVTNTIPNGDVIIYSTSNVVFNATHKIVLSEGFQVRNNAGFKALIYDSPCY